MKWTFLDILSLTFGNFDATLEKTLYSTSFESSQNTLQPFNQNECLDLYLKDLKYIILETEA